ncbi:CoA-binding protein [Ancylomarina sp. DW003]|nr:CoA-binding protein [Ancylomarina sp. DW003]MDE5423047.1 CoA-binding protein [Ancylomarina sp. DW003]
MRTTLVIGASTNKDRYSNKCIKLLKEHKIKTFAIGNKEGTAYTVDIQVGFPHFTNINTVAIYLSPKNQKDYYDYLISLKPQRILFPPGTENPEFETKARAHGILTEQACPLVMLNVGTY